MTPMTEQARKAIEDKYVQHEAQYQLKKAQERLIAQAIFFTGAMEACTALGVLPPTSWLIDMLNKQDIIKNRAQ